MSNSEQEKLVNSPPSIKNKLLKDNFVSKSQANDSNSNDKPEMSLTNKFFCFLLVIVGFGSCYMAFRYTTFWDEYDKYVPEGYKKPMISDLIVTLIALPIILICRMILEKCFSNLANYIISKKYREGANDIEAEANRLARKKLAQNMFKFCFYCCSITLGYQAIKDIPFYPYELFGKGDMMNMFTGFPSFMFFKKTELFDMYYLISLAYVLSDMVFLLLIHEIQSDFYIMFLHHISTISLISFSYLTQCSQIGITVLFIHDFTDIFVYAVRTIIHLEIHDYLKIASGIIMIVNFIYLRFYVFVKLILLSSIYFDHYNVFFITLIGFLYFLVCMHLYWILAILARLGGYFTKGKIDDIGPERKKVA